MEYSTIDECSDHFEELSNEYKELEVSTSNLPCSKFHANVGKCPPGESDLVSFCSDSQSRELLSMSGAL